MHEHRMLLPDAVGTVGSLDLHGGVPQEVVVEDVVGRREVQPRTAG